MCFCFTFMLLLLLSFSLHYCWPFSQSCGEVGGLGFYRHQVRYIFSALFDTQITSAAGFHSMFRETWHRLIWIMNVTDTLWKMTPRPERCLNSYQSHTSLIFLSLLETFGHYYRLSLYLLLYFPTLCWPLRQQMDFTALCVFESKKAGAQALGFRCKLLYSCCKAAGILCVWEKILW